MASVVPSGELACLGNFCHINKKKKESKLKGGVSGLFNFGWERSDEAIELKRQTSVLSFFPPLAVFLTFSFPGSNVQPNAAILQTELREVGDRSPMGPLAPWLDDSFLA